MGTWHPCGPNLYVAEEIKNSRFQIAGGEPGMKVSWQITGIRHDVFAEAHRVEVEVEKRGAEHGTYIYPELNGQPKSLGAMGLYPTERPDLPREE